jgi:hypothetical protein
MNDRSIDWLLQAENGFGWAKDTLTGRGSDNACRNHHRFCPVGMGAMTETIVWNNRDPLYGLTLPGLEQKISGLLAGRVESAWCLRQPGARQLLA